MELERLRRQCQSQDSRQNWRLIARLHSPNRFSVFKTKNIFKLRVASFIAGDSEHVSPNERSMHTELYTDDEGGTDEEDAEVSGYITDD